MTLEIQTVQSTEIQMPSGFKNLHEAVSYDPLVHLTIHLITFGLCHNKFFHHKCQGSVLACTTTKFHMAPAREPKKPLNSEIMMFCTLCLLQKR